MTEATESDAKVPPPPTQESNTDKGITQRDSSCKICSGLIPQGDYHRESKVNIAQLSESWDKGCKTCGILRDVFLGCLPDAASQEGEVIWNIRLSRFKPIWLSDYTEIRLDIFKLPSTVGPFGCLHSRSIPSGHTGSSAAFRQAKEWVTGCTKSHNLCGTGPACPLPTRVLDLGTNESSSIFKICVTQNRVARYICLSHCWGSHKTPTTLIKDNLDSLVKGSLISGLPQTYQDAILVTKRFGIRYLWIDSLCIVQDNADDWRRESSKMAEVYQNSYLTIAATCSAGGEEGIFTAPQPSYATKTFEFSNKGSETHIYGRQLFPHHRYDLLGDSTAPSDFSNTSPLLSRAWVYQERLLSPRVLHFMQEELVFECAYGRSCECGYFQSSRYDFSLKKSFTESIQKATKQLNQDHWYEVVYVYSKLKLTFGKDKLPALSGVAKLVNRQLKDVYLAGLWRSNLAKQLCWSKPNGHQTPKPLQWRAPSWSWAATDGRVSLFSTRDETFVTFHETICEPKGIDDTGEVKSGYIKLSGKIAPAVLVPMELRTSETRRYGVDPSTHFDVSVGGKCDLHYTTSFDPDYKIPVEFDQASMNVTCLLLMGGLSAGSWTDLFLVLKLVDETIPEYERIGIVTRKTSSREEWIPDETKTVTIKII
ncbi:hypothetical protein G7Y89_g12697 [Cudoniella acicularis]|uniref:Heterokaryon incompatibility domain-containing protein n=1 Tax=Cudoniella acicularis TaxID=354080 RepID=A0A8H4VWQ8_9HELO|nr:hypothetical protein G7Y89_g12697 [Cudoniella acicularis]